MTGAAIVGGVRTPFCRAGGGLRELSVLDLALAATRGASADAIVAASAFEPTLAAQLGAAFGIEGRAVQVGGLDAAGLHALAVAAAMVGGGEAGSALAIGADSASRTPYLAAGLRWGAREGATTVEDPLSLVVAGAGRRAEGAAFDRASVDAFAGRSHAATPLEQVVLAGEVSADEPAAADRGPEALAALKPLFDADGAVTAGATALPADGAAAALLVPRSGAPDGALAILAVAATPEAALERAGMAASQLAVAEIHEGTAAEALALAGRLGLDRSVVNAAGGAIGLGHPVAATGIVMALRLQARLAAAGGGAGLLAAPGCAIATRLL